jgi:GTPase
MPHKSGFVNIIGSPNVGKSTLMNALVGENLSIITPKAQTTRHRILGLLNTEDYQIIFSDTPGMLKPHYKLHESMMKFVDGAFKDADIFLLMTEPSEKAAEHIALDKLKKTSVPVVVLVNKIDLSEQDAIAQKLEEWQTLIPNAVVIPVSAKMSFNLEKVLDVIIANLPEHEPFYSKDEITDRPEKFFIAEILREKIFLYYQQEIPYCTEVTIETYTEEENLIRIRAIIHVTRDSQKGIIIGEGGKALKAVGTKARRSMEEFLKKKVFLQTVVKVSKDWRDDTEQLKRFGYNPK